METQTRNLNVTPISRGINRRRGTRYQHGNLSVWVRHTGVWGRLRRPHVVTWMDFNRLGMSFESGPTFRVSEELLLSFSIHDLERETISNVAGIVRYIIESAEGRRVGVEFAYQANEHMRSPHLKRSLVHIESVLGNILERLGESER